MVTSKSDIKNTIDVFKIEAYKVMLALSVSAHGKIYTESLPSGFIKL